MCGTGYPTKEEAEGCEASHEKNVKVNKFEYVHNVDLTSIKGISDKTAGKIISAMIEKGGGTWAV